MYYCYGLTIDGCYFEQPGTASSASGIFGSNCYGIVINSLNVSVWSTNQTMLKFNSCSGITINGFNCETGIGDTSTVSGSIGMHFTGCRGVVINGPKMNNIATGMYFNDTRGIVSAPEFAYVTTPIEFYNHTYVQLIINMHSAYYSSCVIGSTAATVVRFNFIDLPIYGPTTGIPIGYFRGQHFYDTTLGHPIFCLTAGVKEVDTLTVNTGATNSGNVTVTLNGFGTTVAVLAGDTAINVADKIRSTAFTGWTVGGTTGTNTVVFTENAIGASVAPSFTDTGSTGATATFVVTTAGTNGTWVGHYTTVPSSATATGVKGQYAVDASYYYICTATNTWKRVAIAAW
jgi:hypothetical protein